MSDRRTCHRAPMKLSEAIRIGAERRPQCRDVFFNRIHGQLCSCALGAAFEGGDLIDQEMLSRGIVALHMELVSAFEGFELYSVNNSGMLPFPCPSFSCRERPAQLPEVIVHLNDEHNWTREQIADWLEEIGY